MEKECENIDIPFTLHTCCQNKCFEIGTVCTNDRVSIVIHRHTTINNLAFIRCYDELSFSIIKLHSSAFNVSLKRI